VPENGSELHPAIEQLARTSKRVKNTIAVLLMSILMVYRNEVGYICWFIQIR
jgi:hypothetical protein